MDDLDTRLFKAFCDDLSSPLPYGNRPYYFNKVISPRISRRLGGEEAPNLIYWNFIRSPLLSIISGFHFYKNCPNEESREALSTAQYGA